ncbi:hypothetical protein SSX86_004110 [Deinandra increscens subsp. villosa]|uniref:Phytocyanin domain-containing protein n=1 Tax=Deinandra increscens subsp. villosa TaxID=3103831 RepID=A0AAP0H8J3_9ASTR
MEKMVVVVVVAAMLVVCMQKSTAAAASSVYTVGGSAGWTTIGNVDYKQWAATKTFKIGDTIVFTYNKQFHNVMQVSHAEYRSCNVSSTPIATHSTGNDSIIIKTYGHHFYLCAVPGHCQSGQKLDINVQRPAPPADNNNVQAPSPSSSSDPLASPDSQLQSPSATPTVLKNKPPNSIGKATSLLAMNNNVLVGLAIAAAVFVV